MLRMCGRPEPPDDRCMRTSGIRVKFNAMVLEGELCKCDTSMCNNSAKFELYSFLEFYILLTFIFFLASFSQ